MEVLARKQIPGAGGGTTAAPGFRFLLLAKTDVDGNLKISDSKKRLIFYMLYYAYKKLVAFCSLFFC